MSIKTTLIGKRQRDGSLHLMKNFYLFNQLVEEGDSIETLVNLWIAERLRSDS